MRKGLLTLLLVLVLLCCPVAIGGEIAETALMDDECQSAPQPLTIIDEPDPTGDEGDGVKSITDDPEPVGYELRAIHVALKGLIEQGRIPATQDLRGTAIISDANAVVFDRLPERSETMSACDSNDDCDDSTDEMCKNAGHEGVDSDTVMVVEHIDGSKTCSGDCKKNGAVAFVTCSPE